MDIDLESICITKKVVISDCSVSNFGLKSNVFLDIFDLNVDYKEDIADKDFMLIGLFYWRDTEESNQLMATFGILQKTLKAIERQHYICPVFREDHSLSVKADKSLQDIPSEQVNNTLTEQQPIGCGVVHLGVELGLSTCNIRETMHNFKKDLNGKIHDLLMKWRKRDGKNKVKTTIYRLMVALKHVKAAAGLSFVKKTYGVE